MSRPVAATPIVSGADAERVFGVFRPGAKKLSKAAVARRAKKLADARAMFKEVKSPSKRKRG